MGGTLTGEHGIGSLKKEFLEEALGADAVQIMRDIKSVLDPKWLLNQNKMFPTGAGAMDIGSREGAVRAAGIISGLGSIGSAVQELAIGKVLDHNKGALGPVLAMLALGALGTALAYVVMAESAGRIGSSRASASIYLIPVVSLLLGSLVRHEHVAALSVAGSAVALCGAWLASRG